MRTVPSTPPTTPPRAAGRPSKFPSGEGQRVTVWVDRQAWVGADEKAKSEGRDRSDAVQELVQAYAEGRVRISKSAPKAAR